MSSAEVASEYKNEKKQDKISVKGGIKTKNENENGGGKEKEKGAAKGRRTTRRASCTSKPNALSEWPDLMKKFRGKKLAIFLDYDGTLTPIVNNPSQAFMPEETRKVVEAVSQVHSTAIVTGRKVDTIVEFVQLNNLYYAGSHGFQIRGPNNCSHVVDEVEKHYLPALGECYKLLETELNKFNAEMKGEVDVEESAGVKVPISYLLEDNKYSISIHYRNVPDEDECKRAEKLVDSLVAKFGTKLKKTFGKKVYEIRANFDWNKGAAVAWLLKNVFNAQNHPTIALYFGDDITDEDAFAELANSKMGFGIFVRLPDNDRDTAASYVLQSPVEVREFLSKLTSLPSTLSSPKAIPRAPAQSTDHCCEKECLKGWTNDQLTILFQHCQALSQSERKIFLRPRLVKNSNNQIERFVDKEVNGKEVSAVPTDKVQVCSEAFKSVFGVSNYAVAHAHDEEKEKKEKGDNNKKKNDKKSTNNSHSNTTATSSPADAHGKRQPGGNKEKGGKPKQQQQAQQPPKVTKWVLKTGSNANANPTAAAPDTAISASS